MPDPAKTKNDGGIKFVRQTVTISDDGDVDTIYIVTKGSIKAGAKRVTQENENGVENKQAFMATIRSGTLSLQFVNDTDKPPKQFEEVTLKDTSGTDITVIIAEVDQDFGPDTPATVSCQVYEKQAA